MLPTTLKPGHFLAESKRRWKIILVESLHTWTSNIQEECMASSAEIPGNVLVSVILEHAPDRVQPLLRQVPAEARATSRLGQRVLCEWQNMQRRWNRLGGNYLSESMDSDMIARNNGGEHQRTTESGHTRFFPEDQIFQKRNRVTNFFCLSSPCFHVLLSMRPSTTKVKHKVSSGEGMTIDAATAVAKSADETRPPGTSEHSASTEAQISVSSCEAGSSWPGEEDMTVDAPTAVAKSAGEVRLLGIAEHSASDPVVARICCRQRAPH